MPQMWPSQWILLFFFYVMFFFLFMVIIYFNFDSRPSSFVNSVKSANSYLPWQW